MALTRSLKGPELNDKIASLVQTHLGGSGEDAARKDNVSHHILRLAYAGTEEKRRWLITHEVALFRWGLVPLAVGCRMFSVCVCVRERGAVSILCA